MRETACDVLVVGGGTGGCAAAMAACSLGMRVILTEETDWIGGQLTSQAVPPDEHPWIEQFGCTTRYRAFRNGVRRFYRDNMPLTGEALSDPALNPGGGWVSRLCHEPRIGWQVLNQMLQPAISRGLLDIRLHTVVSAAATDGDRVTAVSLFNRLDDSETIVIPKFVLDATELGDLLPMTHTEYAVGAESRAQTNEPNAVDGPEEPSNLQGLTWVFAMAYDEGSHRIIDKPEQYERWKAFQPSFWPGPLIGFDDLNPHTGERRHIPMFSGKQVAWYGGDFGLFTYRQIVRPANFQTDPAAHPVTIVNWPMNDYFVDSIVDVEETQKEVRLLDAKQLSLSLLYWLQTEAPRHDEGVGYPGLYMRPDITGTADGFAKTPYVRESRRIQARFTILEQHIAAYTNPGLDRAPSYVDSVGVGSYRIDLHPTTGGKSYLDTSTLPFEIPLGALVPVRMTNLIPACKNLGVTHITNGCYRLHPVEWNIGEAAGTLAAYCIQHDRTPQQVHESPELTGEIQRMVQRQGVEIRWPKLKAL
ncbi:MAG: FAD-dependent oxidoreductase [Fimbriimonas sp.]|nr:FAD-dependent oxidoreductase [Fimbriimonas sp.]